MPDAIELTKTIKRAAIQAVRADKPTEVCFGKVTSANPLKILVEQKLTLGAAQLVLSRNVTDYTATVSISSDSGWATENESGGSGESAFSSHHHEIVASKKKITIHNGLVVGDEVILVRQQGGQKFIVLDRVGT